MALAAIASGLALSPQSVMAASSAQIVQQAGKVQGTVVDGNGEAVIGATVKVGEIVWKPIAAKMSPNISYC